MLVFYVFMICKMKNATEFTILRIAEFRIMAVTGTAVKNTQPKKKYHLLCVVSRYDVRSYGLTQSYYSGSVLCNMASTQNPPSSFDLRKIS